MVLTGGRVGINTTSPVEELHIVADGSVTTDGSTNGAGLGIYNSTVPSERLLMGYDSTIADNGAGYISAARTGVAWTKLLLNPNGGNVLIGSTSDNGSKLQVNTPLPYLGSVFGVYSSAEPTNYNLTINAIAGGSGNVPFAFNQVDGGALHNNVLVFSRGSLGINTSTPSEQLSVVGNIAFGNTEGKAKMVYNPTENSIDFIIN